VGRPRRRWFRQLLEHEEREKLARNREMTAEDFSTVDPNGNGMIEDMEVLT
jgi:hypothetical protein